MDKLPIGRLAALARRKETRRWVRCELPGLDRDDILRKLVEEYDRSAELTACEIEVSNLRDEVGHLERERDKAETKAEDLRRRLLAIYNYETSKPESDQDADLLRILNAEQICRAERIAKERAEQMKEKP